MNSRGFTLIELIVTIALLAIIAVISFVSINSIVNQSRVNDCETLVNNIKSATNSYVSDNRYNKDFVNLVVDYSINITARQLIDNNYLSGEIVDPFNKEVVLDSESIIITISLNDDYTVDTVAVSGITCDVS